VNSNPLAGDDFQRELIWTLSRCTDLTQEAIADHRMVQKSQPSVSRILDEYDPARDGFEIAASGFGDLANDDELDEDALEQYRDAVATLMQLSPMLRAGIGMAKLNTPEN